jgi:hypothetical protein
MQKRIAALTRWFARPEKRMSQRGFYIPKLRVEFLESLKGSGLIDSRRSPRGAIQCGRELALLLVAAPRFTGEKQKRVGPKMEIAGFNENRSAWQFTRSAHLYALQL